MSNVVPQERIDKNVSIPDFGTQVELYTTTVCNTVVSHRTCLDFENPILEHFKEKHRRMLSKSLRLLPYHVWDDGTPIKRNVQPVNPLDH